MTTKLKVTADQVTTFLNEHDIHPTVVHVRNGVYTAKRSYHIGASKILAAMLEKMKQLHSIDIVDSGDHYHSFVGGARAGSAQDSYVWVSFTLKDKVWVQE